MSYYSFSFPGIRYVELEYVFGDVIPPSPEGKKDIFILLLFRNIFFYKLVIVQV